MNPDVRAETIQAAICVSGYTASVRPSTLHTSNVKLGLMREAGLAPATATDYELDHRVPLALGGHPRALTNLQLQPWQCSDRAKVKDSLEKRLQTSVCAGSRPLDEARSATYRVRPAVYRRYVPK